MQNILISGAASGIGAASARLFHRRGRRVGLLDIDAEALRGLAAELPGAWQSAVDVSEPDAVGEALAQFCADGRLRLLFNCAGILRFGRFEEVALEDHARLLAINLQGVLNCCHAAFPFLRATPQAGYSTWARHRGFMAYRRWPSTRLRSSPCAGSPRRWSWNGAATGFASPT